MKSTAFLGHNEALRILTATADGKRPSSGPSFARLVAMIARFFLILGSLIAIGIVGTFLLFVSALSLLATIAVGMGLLATFVMGYWAGTISLSPATRAKRLQKLSVINAPADIIYYPELPTPNQPAQRDSLPERFCEVAPIR